MDGTFGALMAVGGLIKHLVPTKKINNFIPVINTLVGAGLRLSQGNDPLTALGMGFSDAMMATGAHQTAKIATKKHIQVGGQSL